jgi:uncharacterized protein YjbJ (UPF0337 family)
MGLNDKINAAAKSAEGQLQSAAGELTGDERLKLEGEGKQLQAKVMDAAGDLKDKVQDVAGDLGDKAQEIAGDLGDKAKEAAEAIGGVIGGALKGLHGKDS